MNNSQQISSRRLQQKYTHLSEKTMWWDTIFVCSFRTLACTWRVAMYFDYRVVATYLDHQTAVKRDGLNKTSKLSVF